MSSSGVRLDRCLLLRKPSLVDLGSPEEHLTVAGGHVTVELWVQFLDKEDAATLYQHGDRSTNGEVFLELIRWEGSYCIRGGYRHDVRGSCLVSAPLPPTGESRPLHVGLVFNGRWRLFFEGEEVAGNRQGPHVSLDAPKQRWTVGAGCTCLLTGLRVWRLGRTAREMSRDFRRSLAGDEPGLVAQFFFNERGGNVVLNYVHQVKASHAVCNGGFAHVPCDTHPWRNYGASSCVVLSSASSLPTGTESLTNPETAVGSLASDSPPACARLHEWRDLTLTNCCVTRHSLLLSTPVGDGSPYPTKEGGHALMFFDLNSGVAHRSMFFLTNRSPVRHWMHADPAGRLWEMFEVDASLVKGEQEASYLLSLLNATGSAPQRPRERILAVVPLPLEEEGVESLCTFVEDENSFADDEHGHAAVAASSPGGRRTSHAAAAASSAASGSIGTSTSAESEQSLSQLLSFAALVAQPSATVSYSTVALWLLKLLAAHADADPGADQALFMPLADDVSSRCVTEVRVILGEHFRVVKATNARRAVAPRGSLSWVVVAAALRVLLRLIRRARAFGLHPGPLKLTVVKESADGDDLGKGRKGSTQSAQGTAAASEATMTLLLRELNTSSLRRRTGVTPLLRSRTSIPEVPSASLASMKPATVASCAVNDSFESANSSTLLGLLADVINEDGLTLPPIVATLARTVTVEGVGLFLPDVRQRARLLRDLLRASSPHSASPLSSATASTRLQGDSSGTGGKRLGGKSNTVAVNYVATAAAEERVPAMNVLLDAVAQSFTTVLAAAPLLCVEDGVASLSDVCSTLRTLLEESTAQWRRKWASSSPSPSASSTSTSSSSPTAAAAALKAAVARPSNSFHAFAFSLSEAIASLQLLLLSACQGSRWEVALTQMHSHNGAANGGGSTTANGRTVDGSGAASSSGDGSGSGGGNGSTVQSNTGGLPSTRDTISAAALDLQHLCFSQAASYHPCVRIYYSALFNSAESCLSLCAQEQYEDQQQADPHTEKRTSSLPAMVASLAPTFLTAPLHTALSAIPLVLTVEDGEWFLNELDRLLSLSEKLLDATSESPASDSSADNAAMPNEVNRGGGSSVAAARRLLSSLRESLYYASVWVAAFLFNSSTVSSASVKEAEVRQRLGLASVTTTPTAQRTVTNLTATLDGTPGAKLSALPSPNPHATRAEEEAAAVWEHPLMEGGVWPDAAHSPKRAAQNSTNCCQRRGVYMAQLIHNTAHWSAKQIAFDHLASKTPSAMGSLITIMAAAALHLSSLPLQSFTAAQVDKLMCDVMQQLSRPVRTELMSRHEEEAANGDATTPLNGPSPVRRQWASDATLKELQQRCELLLRVRTCTELWEVENALYALPTCDTVSATASSSRGAGGPPPPSQQQQRRRCTKQRLHDAWHSYRLRHMRYRAHVASRPSCTLHEAIQLVKGVVLSRALTSACLHAALRQREGLAALRQVGIERLLQLVKRAPYCAESVAQLLSAQGRGAHSHFEDGLRGCGSGYVERIRAVLYELLRCSIAAESDQRNSGAGAPSFAGSASVLCGLLDRAWQPRELAFFVELRVVPALVERYVTLFRTPSPASQTSSTPRVHHKDGDNTSGRQPSDVGGLKPKARGSGATASAPSKPSAAGGIAPSHTVELRPVALTERRHRDQVVSAQQARRTTKSTLVSAAILRYQSTAGESGQHGGSSAAEGGDAGGPLQYTASEATQAKVWLTVKHLMLQSTAMLTARRLSTMSRVEQTAVMSFLADSLRAIGSELQHCRDILAWAVKDTPVLLAQAGDSAVLEPLVTVQDQVDVLCSLLSVVAGTLSTASISLTRSSDASAEEHNDSSADEALLVNASLSTVCASIAETLLELVFLDLYHAHVVRKEAGVGCVVRDAAACARIASLLLCRCQPAAVRHFMETASSVPSSVFAAASSSSPTWKDIYASPVFSAGLSAIDAGHICLKRWLDLSTYAVATTGLSRTAQHVLLAFRRLLQQQTWAAELRCFADAYKRLVLAYEKSIHMSGSEGTEGWQSSGGNGTDCSGSAVACTRVRELSAVQLHVWAVVLGGQLLAPPSDLGMEVSYLDEKDGLQPTLAYVVDVESVGASSASAGASSAPTPSLQAAACTSRHVRGASHFPWKAAAAMVGDGEPVRSVVVIPTDPSSGHLREADEVTLSPHQLFIPAWDDPAAEAVVVPPYAGLVDDFLMPALQHGIPLLSKKLHAAAALTSMELSMFVSLLHLTVCVMRARPDLARRLIESGALQCIRQHTLQGVVRLPFPLKVLKEWAALVAVRAAEEVAERVYTREEDRRCEAERAEEVGVRERAEGEREGKLAPYNTHLGSNCSAVSVNRSATPIAAVPPATTRPPPGAASDSDNNSSPPYTTGGASSSRPVYTSLSAPLAPYHGSSEALLDTLRSGDLSANTPAFLSGGYVVGGMSAPSSTSPSLDTQITTPAGLARDIATDYGLLRLARTFGVFAGTYGGSSMSAVLGNPRSQPGLLMNAATAASAINNSANSRNTATDSSSIPAPARVPPRTELSVNGGVPMFLSFPMWDPHPLSCDSAAASQTAGGAAPPHIPAAVTITPSRPEVRFPVWDDGFAIETAVILNDGDVYPAMGDSLSIPCPWAPVSLLEGEEDRSPSAPPSPFEFPLVTLYVAADEKAATGRLLPFIQIKVHRSSLSATITFPGTDGGAHGGPETVSVAAPMRREDWHHCMHVSLMCNASCMTLCRNGEPINAELRSDTGRRLEKLLRQDGFIRSVVLGRPAPAAEAPASTVDAGTGGACAMPVREMNGPMALLGGLRIWGTSVLRTSVRVVADLVARDHALQPFGLPEHLCFFEMKEGSGGIVCSADASHQYRGVLSGCVRWSIEPLPLGFYPSIEINSGRPRTGVATVPGSSTRLPRSTMSALVQSLLPFHFSRFAGDVMWSLLSMAARHATITALEVGISPAYDLLSPLNTPAGDRLTRPSLFDPRHVLDTSQKVSYQLSRLFQLQDSGCLPNRYERLIHGVVQRLVAVLAAEEVEDDGEGKHNGGAVETARANQNASLRGGKPASTAIGAPPSKSAATAPAGASPLAAFVSDTALLLRQLRRDDGELFVMELPPAAMPPSPPSATTAPVPPPQGAAILPIAFANGGTGVLAFDAKYRNIEQAALYKDMELKNILVKFPDGQGGWPAYTLTASQAPWAYLRSVPSTAGYRMAMGGKGGGALSSSILTVTIKSLKPVILHAIVRALCDALRTLTSGECEAAAGRRTEGRSRACKRGKAAVLRTAAACLLDARVVASLIQQSSARSSDDDCVHLVLILVHLLKLWRCMPQVAPYDQLPLAVAMSHLNISVCNIIQHANSDGDLGSIVSVTTGTYNPYVQALVSLWTAAIHVNCAWAGRTYVEQLRSRWQRLIRMWRRVTVNRPTASLLPPHRSSRTAPSQAAKSTSGVTSTDASPGRPAPQPYTPPSSPGMRAKAPVVNMAYTRAQLRTAPLSADVPHAQGSAPAKAEQHGDLLSEQLLANAPHAVRLVALEQASPSSRLQRPQLESPVSLSFPANGEGTTKDVNTSCVTSTRRPPYPKGVTRKGNGLWIVKGGSGSTVDTSHDDPARSGNGGGPDKSGCATTVRSSVGFTSGAVYWEVYVTKISRAERLASLTSGATLVSNVIVGVATERFTPTFTPSGPDGAGVFLGNDSESWAFDGGRALRYFKGCSLEASPRAKWKMDDVIGLILDISRNRLCCLHNGRLVSEFNGSFLSPQQCSDGVALFPVIICTGEGSCEVNFGATGFASTPPPGCLPVDLSLYLNEETARVWKLVLADEVVVQSGRGTRLGVNTGSSTSASAAEKEEVATGESSGASALVAGGVGRGVSSRPARLLTHPALPYLCRHLAAYSKGRFGPLDVALLCPDNNAKTVSSRECKTDKEPSLLLGSVAVTSGRWYFEVVLPGEPTFHVGWYAWKALEEQGGGGQGGANAALGPSTPIPTILSSPNGRPQLGHDASSWGFDAARMAARHNKHQVSFTRRAWKCGDVVGCLLDCNAGSVSFMVNGEELVEAHGGTTTSSAISGRSPAATPLPQPQTAPASAPSLRAQTDSRPGNTNASAEVPNSTPSPIFTGVSLSETRGLVPAIFLEPKSSLVCLWNRDEHLYPPGDDSYQALGGAHVVRNALVELLTEVQPSTSSGGSKAPPKKAGGASCSSVGVEQCTTLCSGNALDASITTAKLSRCLNAAALQKLLHYASKVQELHPTSLRSYTMPSLYNIPPVDSPSTAVDHATSTEGPQSPSRSLPQQQQQQQRDLCSASGLDVPQLHTHLAALAFFAHLSSFLHPFAHAASLPIAVEDTPLGGNWAVTDLHRTLKLCRSFAPPWTALRVLQWSLGVSNGAGDAVRLSLNRRKALTVLRDPSASVTRRLRDSLFGQVYQLLSTKAPALFTTNKKMWAVTFYGEGADDVGGPYRECLTQMCTELMSASLTLFLPSANMTSELGEVRDAFVVNPVCAPPVELLMYRFLGRLMGGCLRGGEPLSLYLPSALWKCLVGDVADDSDLVRVDAATRSAIEYVECIAGITEESRAPMSVADEGEEERNAELAELCPGGFTLLNDAGVEDELVPGGAQIPVTTRNAGLYVRLVREHKLYGSGAAQRRALQKGFHEVVPLCSVAELKWYELEELVCGQCDYDPDALLDAARLEDLDASDTRVGFLREVLRGFTRHQRALFMRFVSGRERLPPGIRLKIMPDDAPRVSALSSASPRAPRTMSNASVPTSAAATGIMTPQPPPPQTSNVGSSRDSSGGSSSDNARAGTFVRHGAFQQCQSSGGHNTGTVAQPPSPPQLGLTLPPSPSMPLSPRLTRTMQPPVLQPQQLLSDQRGADAAPSRTHLAPEQPTHHTATGVPRRDAHPAQDANPSLCDDARLPHASTCFYWLRLPRYSSAAVMAEKLLFAVEQCVDIDADFRVRDTDVAEQEAGPSLARVSSDEDDLFEDFSHLR
ncbi:hypothetical protein ABL78_1226 [Leptomonas seymouri]|uniref:HECT domain-containing protein n=1 Tax=Leptomonas seymouri TaxID=5684 RepID=A0A0N1I2H9_LEPSE|nr:hypothetical protein ABL78_1226 [Leptomonas seymouri]|eukprot:KPI89645.1 hypothetical protein ABL78_1226 [Leptomonas seymouri]